MDQVKSLDKAYTSSQNHSLVAEFFVQILNNELYIERDTVWTGIFPSRCEANDFIIFLSVSFSYKDNLYIQRPAYTAYQPLYWGSVI